VVAPAEVGLIAGSGIADDEQSRQSSVEWGVFGDGSLGWSVRDGGSLCDGGDGEEEVVENMEGPGPVHGG